jgi:hypothetical protein
MRYQLSFTFPESRNAFRRRTHDVFLKDAYTVFVLWEQLTKSDDVEDIHVIFTDEFGYHSISWDDLKDRL